MSDSTMRLRRMRDLIEQIKEDYAELNRVRNGVRDREKSRDEKENEERLLSWLESELSTLRRLQGRDIETIIGAQLHQIEKETRKRLNDKNNGNDNYGGQREPVAPPSG